MCRCDTTKMTRKNSSGLVKVHKATTTTAKHSLQHPKLKTASKVVRFSETRAVAFRHVTRDELQKTWYTPKEYDAFKEDAKRTAADYREAQGDITRLDPAKVCLRGLEQNLTRISIMSRRMTIASSINMVLHEQFSQKARGQSNPEKVRDVCMVMSDAARRRAITVAAFDAKLCQL